jgi:E3 ubiquitin-protein ligase UBR2
LLSELLLYLLDLVLVRADNLKSRCFSEDQVHKVLYLIGIGLLEEDRISRSSSEAAFPFASRARDAGILASLERLVGSHRIESHRELLAWVLRRLRQQLGIQEAVAAGSGGAAAAVADGELVPAEEDAEAKARKMAAAAARRAKIMQQMAAQQKTFMTENKKLFEETPSGLRGADHKASVCDWSAELCEEGEGEGSGGVQICLGPNRSQPSPTDSSYTCILCQEDEELEDTEARTLVMASFIQRSTVLSRQPRSGSSHMSGSSSTGSEFPFLPADLHSAPHTSSCGHVMHATCWQKYFDDVAEAERRRYRLAALCA